MIVYELRAPREGAEFASTDDAGWDAIHAMHQVDWPTSAADGWSVNLWRETVDYASGGPLGPADIMYLTGSVLCGRRSVLSAIEDLLHPFGTFLEARVADDVDLFLFRPHVRPGAVDRERSSFVLFPSGEVMLIQSLEFRRDAIEGIPIFSTDVSSVIDVYFSAAFLERLVRAKVRLGTEILKVWEG
ncbi:MAG: hypothetical protein HOO96_28480 [Polyangiaceae bacterium]|nr:hypothetical protein [Polyangiaceae bacterium]